MKSAFPGHFANNSESINRLWGESIIALDANVLLDLYRYSDSTRAAFLNVLDLLKDRIWISHQVAAEYFSNRLGVISDQAKHYEDAIKNLEKLKVGFESQKQHPFVASNTLAGFVDSFERVVSELRASKEAHEQRINDDEIKEVLGALFDGRVGQPYADDKLEELVVAGAERYKNKVPPGFKDSKKPAGETLRERCVPYGDYIGWSQVMDYSISKSCGVILVTGDAKEDWWLKHSGRTLGPLPDLVEEFMSKTTHSFYMYPPDRFLEYANNYLRQEASPEAVEEIREVRVADLSDDELPEWALSPDGWVRTVYPRRHAEGLDKTAGRRVNELGFLGEEGLSNFSDRDLAEYEEVCLEKIDALHKRRDRLRAKQSEYLFQLDSLDSESGDLEFDEVAYRLSERLNSVSHKISELNDKLRANQTILDTVRSFRAN